LKDLKKYKEFLKKWKFISRALKDFWE
jgi:hypothetical protein